MTVVLSPGLWPVTPFGWAMLSLTLGATFGRWALEPYRSRRREAALWRSTYPADTPDDWSWDDEVSYQRDMLKVENRADAVRDWNKHALPESSRIAAPTPKDYDRWLREQSAADAEMLRCGEWQRAGVVETSVTRTYLDAHPPHDGVVRSGAAARAMQKLEFENRKLREKLRAQQHATPEAEFDHYRKVIRENS